MRWLLDGQVFHEMRLDVMWTTSSGVVKDIRQCGVNQQCAWEWVEQAGGVQALG